MLRNGIRSRSKSTLISTESSSSAHRSASSSSGTCLTTIQGKSVVLHHRTVIFGCQKLAVTREAIFHDENDLPTHLMLYLDQEIKDLSNPMRPAEENHLTCMQKTEDVINQVKVMLQKAFNSSHPKVRQFCDAALQETNLGVLHTLAKHLLDEGFQYIEEYLEKTSGISYMDQEEAYRVCESHVMEETYDVVFFKISQLVQEIDVEVSNVLESMSCLDIVQLGLPDSHVIRRRVDSAVDTLRRIGSYRTPSDKLDSLLKSITHLSEFHTDSTEVNEKLDSDALVSMTIITIIRGHVPHLIANMTYIKEFTFQQNLEIGKYGFAISTFDAVIQYILESRTELASLSDRNNKLWISIRQGDINDVQSILPDKKNSNNSGNSDTLPSDYRASHRFAENSARCFSLFPTADLLHVRDPLGNTPLLIAAGAGWAAVVDYLLLLDPDSAGVANNAGQTALMRACQSGSVDTVKRLLVDASCCLAAQDDKGYTAFLHACVNGDPAILDLLLTNGVDHMDPTVRNHRGQGPLHLATTADALEYLIQRLPSDILPWQDYEGKTFLHVQKKHPIDSNTMASLLSIRDYYGQTPLLAWATNGWFDNIEAVLWFAEDRNLYAHNRGQTILHAMATALDPSRPQVTTLSPCTIENIVRRLAWLVDVREWANGNTVLHLAANLRLTDCNRPFVFSFIRSLLIHAGARIESTNERGVRAVNASRDPDMIAFLTEMIIEAHRHGDSNMVASLSINDADTGRDTLHCYNFRVTGASALHTTIQYTIASVPAHSPQKNAINDEYRSPLAWKQELKTINRTLQDFYQLRQDIVRECPELFLPTLRHLVDPEQVGLQPEPPVCLQEEAVRQLDGFMQWLESHPTLRDHDLVQTFVRSQTLEREMIENASFARRDLLLEAIGKFPLAGNDFGGSEDEEYFFSFSQHQIETLREALTGILRAGRRVAQCRQDLEAVASQIGQLLDRCNDYCDEKKRDRKGDKVVAGSDPRRLCIAMTGDTAYGSSPLDDLVRGFQMMRDLIDGILMALQHPLWLLHRRIELREHLEHERDHLRRVKSWNEVFSTQRQQVEQTQNNVSKTLSDLARTGRQIARSHQMISDEMAHFQRVHPVQLKDMMKSYCRTQLLQERLRLLWLQEQANELMSRRSGH